MQRDAQDALLAVLQQQAFDGALLSAREGALVRYADRLTRDPAAVTEQDIRDLRAAGLDDRAIHDACAIIAYYAFVNRMADGLGVELETGGPATGPG